MTHMRPAFNVAASAALGALALVLTALVRADLAVDLVLLIALAAGAYLVWCSEPRYIFTLAILAAPFASNWEKLGVPGQLAPERMLLAVGILTVLLKGPGIRNRVPLRFEWAHWMLALVAIYAIASALFANTLFQKASGIELLETFGILPFLVFTLAPVVFPTARERATLLKGLVVLGAYLSLTTLFEMTGVDALVFPRYILDPTYGIHFGRGRGPFVEAVANGFALYACGVACVIAARQWRGLWRVCAGATTALCLVGAFLTLERSVWISTIAASIVTLLVVRSTRRWIFPAVVIAGVSVAAAVMFVPGLSSKVNTRANDKETVWDRENLKHTSMNMISAHPLLGVGWARYASVSANYVELDPNIPLTASEEPPHSILLKYTAELGVVGACLWIAAVMLGVGGALLTRGPPDLEPWRAGLLAVFIFFVIQENFVPPTVFQNLCLWLWAGVVWSARYQPAVHREK